MNLHQKFFDWVTGAAAMREMHAEHNRKMRLFDQVELDPLSVDRDEFRAAWAREIEGTR